MLRKNKINHHLIKTLITILIAGCMAMACSTEATYKKTHYRNINEQISLIKKYHRYAKDASNTEKQTAKYERLFFEVFPTSFINYLKIFGCEYEDYYQENGTYSYQEKPNLYEGAFNYIRVFNRLTHIDKEAYYNKYIDIHVGGWWEADAITGFGLYTKLIEDTEVCAKVLAKRTTPELLRVFYFMFDQPHLNHDEAKERVYTQVHKLYKKVAKVDPNLAETLKAAYNLLLCYHSCFSDCG